jgi:hypothetical protein
MVFSIGKTCEFPSADITVYNSDDCSVFPLLGQLFTSTYSNVQPDECVQFEGNGLFGARVVNSAKAKLSNGATVLGDATCYVVYYSGDYCETRLEGSETKTDACAPIKGNFAVSAKSLRWLCTF